jgi:hypothetical protein
MEINIENIISGKQTLSITGKKTLVLESFSNDPDKDYYEIEKGIKREFEILGKYINNELNFDTTSIGLIPSAVVPDNNLKLYFVKYDGAPSKYYVSCKSHGYLEVGGMARGISKYFSTLEDATNYLAEIIKGVIYRPYIDKGLAVEGKFIRQLLLANE